MAYFSKETIVASYKVLSTLYPDPNAQGATQKISAIRYLLALDMFYKQFGHECNTKNKSDAAHFIENVGKIVAVNDSSYTSNFFYPLSFNKDYSVGSNFYSVNVVKESTTNGGKQLVFPRRTPSLMYVRSGILIEDNELINNLSAYISKSIHKTALIIWLTRNIELDESSIYLSLEKVLNTMFSQGVTRMLMPNEDSFNSCCGEIGISYNDEIAIIDEKDITELFSTLPQGESFLSQSFQQIFYGAPGTGKSHAVKMETEVWGKKGRVVRTTFHPDSDYATFVGAYKPTTESVQRYDIYNKPMTRDGMPVMEQIITYEFVEQAFLQAYIDAWKNRDEPEFLIIEEINRGNCAQVFGDLFQLLDRGDDGYSEYAIRADRDLQKHLSKAFENVEIADYPNVKTGKELVLPNNLYIRATMNTSDQSLFPIDSAFKRRWDWKYVPIAKGNDNGTELNWMIDVDGDLYDWWTFVRTINKHVFSTTNSEDKQLGFFFCKAKDNIISAETFVCKVIFYLWNDVFKDFGFDDKIFEDKDDNVNRKLSFDKFYLANGKVNIGKIKMFLSNLGITTSIDRNKDNEDGDVDMSTKVTFMVNGNKVRYINQVCHTVIEEYVKLNKALSVQDIIDYWSEYTRYNQSSWIIGNQAKYESLSEADKKKTYSIKTENDESLWVNKNGWVYQDGPGDIRKFIKAVNDAGIGIQIEENRE